MCPAFSTHHCQHIMFKYFKQPTFQFHIQWNKLLWTYYILHTHYKHWPTFTNPKSLHWPTHENRSLMSSISSLPVGVHWSYISATTSSILSLPSKASSEPLISSPVSWVWNHQWSNNSQSDLVCHPRTLLHNTVTCTHFITMYTTTP